MCCKFKSGSICKAVQSTFFTQAFLQVMGCSWNSAATQMMQNIYICKVLQTTMAHEKATSLRAWQCTESEFCKNWGQTRISAIICLTIVAVSKRTSRTCNLISVHSNLNLDCIATCIDFQKNWTHLYAANSNLCQSAKQFKWFFSFKQVYRWWAAVGTLQQSKCGVQSVAVKYKTQFEKLQLIHIIMCLHLCMSDCCCMWVCVCERVCLAACVCLHAQLQIGKMQLALYLCMAVHFMCLQMCAYIIMCVCTAL
jgi:hypothetical protein